MCERRDQAQDSAGAAPKGDKAVGANPWRRSRPPNTGAAAASSGRVQKHLWQKEQTMQRCPRSSSLLARMRCLRARPQMRISSGSSHVNLAHDCRRAMPAVMCASSHVSHDCWRLQSVFSDVRRTYCLTLALHHSAVGDLHSVREAKSAYEPYGATERVSAKVG